MSSFLDEQLDKVYILENLEKSFSKIKSKAPAIVKSMDSGNLFQVRKILNTFPDASLDELMQMAHRGKNFHKFHLQAKKKVRGDQTEMQKIFILINGSLKGIQQTTKDVTLIQAIDKIIISLNEFAKKYGTAFASEGFTLAILMMLLSFFFSNMPVIGKLILTAGTLSVFLLWFGCLLMVIRLVLNTYFSLKGIK
jgi:hypothetical protein